MGRLQSDGNNRIQIGGFASAHFSVYRSFFVAMLRYKISEYHTGETGFIFHWFGGRVTMALFLDAYRRI